VLEHEDVEQILKLLDATPLQEFELETERFKITLRRSSEGGWTQQQEVRRAGVAAREKPSPAPSPANALVAAAGEPASAGVAHEICAPLVGTFYRSPKPGAPPFVEKGMGVGAGTVVAIVETMKLMTSIHAGHAGRIADILIEDGQFVEQGQVLMRVVTEASGGGDATGAA
jgi:acetyl-CoA carboxylase biotin carboxyl carrier protein